MEIIQSNLIHIDVSDLDFQGQSSGPDDLFQFFRSMISSLDRHRPDNGRFPNTGLPPWHRVARGVISTFSWGAKFFLNFSMPPDYWKIGKKQHFICSNLTLFIVPFFLFSLFFFSFLSPFSFFSFFFSFFSFFLFPWGRRPLSPPNDASACCQLSLPKHRTASVLSTVAPRTQNYTWGVFWHLRYLQGFAVTHPSSGLVHLVSPDSGVSSLWSPASSTVYFHLWSLHADRYTTSRCVACFLYNSGCRRTFNWAQDRHRQRSLSEHRATMYILKGGFLFRHSWYLQTFVNAITAQYL